MEPGGWTEEEGGCEGMREIGTRGTDVAVVGGEEAAIIRRRFASYLVNYDREKDDEGSTRCYSTLHSPSFFYTTLVSTS